MSGLPIDALETVPSGASPVALRSLTFAPDLQLLILAPHPDDFDAIGVTLRHFYDQGNPIHLAVLSGGSKGVQDSYAKPPTWEHKARLREQEQTSSCRLFGLPQTQLRFLRLPEADDGELRKDTSNEQLIRACVQALQPDLVFLPCGEDANTGHQRTYHMARMALTSLGKPVLALYNKDPKTRAFRADLYVEFGEDHADWKRQLLRCHDSQQARNLDLRGHGFDDRILRFNRDTAAELGLARPYAEAFQTELFRPKITALQSRP